MPDMPPEFYTPAFAALSLAIATLVTAIKVLYQAKISAEERLQKFAESIVIQATTAIAMDTAALHESSAAILQLARTQFGQSGRRSGGNTR